MSPTARTRLAKHINVGRRIRRLREAKGLSRIELARKLDVDVSSISGWESGLRLPREALRLQLANILDSDLANLLSTQDDTPTFKAGIFDFVSEFPGMLAASARRARRTIHYARLASPFSSVAQSQIEWRQTVAERISSGTLDVQRVEIIYTLDRLMEVLNNIFRYDSKPYLFKIHCAGLKDVVPFANYCVFDNTELYIGGYWTGVPPRPHPAIKIQSRILSQFFVPYWAEIWSRGTLLNIRGARDLSAVREVALSMGLPPRRWNRFVEQARDYEVGDGAPPVF